MIKLLFFLFYQAGLTGALETLCGQAFGAKMYKQLGLYLKTSCQITFIVSVIISVLWFFTEHILLLLHQDPDIAKSVALYVKCLIPGLFAYGFLQNFMRYCQAQGIIFPLVLFSGLIWRSFRDSIPFGSSDNPGF